MTKYHDRLDKNKQKAHRDIIKFIVSYVGKHNISPSLQLIADHLDIGRNAVDRRIWQLVELGYLTKIAKLPRGLFVTNRGKALYLL